MHLEPMIIWYLRKSRTMQKNDLTVSMILRASSGDVYHSSLINTMIWIHMQLFLLTTMRQMIISLVIDGIPRTMKVEWTKKSVAVILKMEVLKTQSVGMTRYPGLITEFKARATSIRTNEAKVVSSRNGAILIVQVSSWATKYRIAAQSTNKTRNWQHLFASSLASKNLGVRRIRGKSVGALEAKNQGTKKTKCGAAATALSTTVKHRKYTVCFRVKLSFKGKLFRTLTIGQISHWRFSGKYSKQLKPEQTKVSIRKLPWLKDQNGCLKIISRTAVNSNTS